jgi:CubicO group peptidase (beta-lactamase class C family)
LDSKVRDILGPDFLFSDPALNNYATLRDLASHRTGLATYSMSRIQPGYDRKMLARFAV